MFTSTSRLDSLNFLTLNQLLVGNAFFILIFGITRCHRRWWLGILSLPELSLKWLSAPFGRWIISASNTEYQTYIKSFEQDLPNTCQARR